MAIERIFHTNRINTRIVTITQGADSRTTICPITRSVRVATLGSSVMSRALSALRRVNFFKRLTNIQRQSASTPV
jgi:hypothetical protein